MNIAKIVTILLILGLVIAGVMFYSWIYQYILYAVIFTYIFNPSINWMERRGIPRLLSIAILYSVIAIVITWSALRVLPILIDQAENLFTFIKDNSQQGEISLLKIGVIKSLSERITYLDTQVPILKLHESFLKLIYNLNSNVMNIPQIIVSKYNSILQTVSLIATVPLIGFFLLKDNIKFRKDIVKSIPNKYYEIIIIIMHKVDEIVGRYLRAMFFEVLIVGSLSAIVFTVLGVDYAILIGFLAGFANIIPYFGPIMGVIFAAISILLAGNPPIMIIYVAIAMYLIQVIDNNFVYPYVVGSTIEMHPLVVLLTVLAGGWAWGIVGMLISVPAVYLIYGVTKSLYRNLVEYKII